MWLSQVCYIGHVTQKSVLYDEYKTGGAFDPPMQSTEPIYPHDFLKPSENTQARL